MCRHKPDSTVPAHPGEAVSAPARLPAQRARLLFTLGRNGAIKGGAVEFRSGCWGGVDREQSPGWQYPPYVTRPQEGGDGGCPGSKWHTSNFPRWILWEWGCEQGRVLQTDRPRTERGRTCQEKLADVTNYAAAFVGHVWCWHTLVVLILLSRARNPYRTMAHGAPS